MTESIMLLCSESVNRTMGTSKLSQVKSVALLYSKIISSMILAKLPPQPLGPLKIDSRSSPEKKLWIYLQSLVLVKGLMYQLDSSSVELSIAGSESGWGDVRFQITVLFEGIVSLKFVDRLFTSGQTFEADSSEGIVLF